MALGKKWTTADEQRLGHLWSAFVPVSRIVADFAQQGFEPGEVLDRIEKLTGAVAPQGRYGAPEAPRAESVDAAEIADGAEA